MNKHKQTRNRTNKQTNKQTKNSRFRNNKILVLVWVLVLLLQHPILVLYLSRSSVVVLPGGWIVFVCLFCLFSLLSFRSSCLLSSSLCGLWQFKFVCCPQVLESVSHQLSCFGLGFSLCLIPRGLFLCLAPFLWGKVSDPSAGPLLSGYCDGLLIIF
jgi:hypothetical protein